MVTHDLIKRLLEREGTGISWCDLTFNPWIGCTKISPACDFCYAEDLATARLGVQWGPDAPRRRTAPGNWSKPPRWNRIAEQAGHRLKVFCASLADVLDNAVDDQWRRDLAALIIHTPWLDWMLLTKRIGNARKMLTAMFPDGVPDNVALGVTIANQEEADRDLPKALSVKAGLGIRRLFVSAEPLLGPLDLSRYLAHIDLLIVGGESGPDARPMHPDWPLDLRDQCAAAGVPFHFKQWGEWAPGENAVKAVTRTERTADWWDDHWDFSTLTPGQSAELHCDDAPTLYRLGVRNIHNTLEGTAHREHFND